MQTLIIRNQNTNYLYDVWEVDFENGQKTLVAEGVTFAQATIIVESAKSDKNTQEQLDNN